MEMAYPDENARVREWKRIATNLDIPIDEDPRLAAERHRKAMAVVAAEFGTGDLTAM